MSNVACSMDNWLCIDLNQDGPPNVPVVPGHVLLHRDSRSRLSTFNVHVPVVPHLFGARGLWKTRYRRRNHSGKADDRAEFSALSDALQLSEVHLAPKARTRIPTRIAHETPADGASLLPQRCTCCSPS